MTSADPRVEHMEGVLERISVEQSEIRQDMRHMNATTRDAENKLRAETQELGVSLRAEIKETENRLRTEMQEMEARLRAEIVGIRSDMSGLQNRMTQMWISVMATMMAGVIAIIIAVFLSS